uniref:Uncharacterized protein n=1 Tax=Lactuca sativa TaxID=4236 RepID=A0A9R1UJ64_LACSA|nr:hypothetical protein LSAT_V11C900482980 [Lactuca sativa]
MIVGMQKKKLALSEVEGSLKEHYAKLWDYAAEIRRANPGSHAKVFLDPQLDNNVVFDRFYVSFKGVVDGWLDGCRKVIGVNGCFLKGVCRGELLSAVVVKERIPDVVHRLCARHILANFHKKVKGEQHIKPFWRVVNTTTVLKFEATMNEIKSLESRAYDYLIDRDLRCWSKAFFREGMDCDAVENGVSESFNSVVLDARRKPVITMLEDIRCWELQRLWMQKKKRFEFGFGHCPNIRREIKDLKE